MRTILIRISLLFLLAFSFISFVVGNKLPLPLPETNVDQNGNLNMGIPVDLLDGTKGLQPELALSYNSASRGGTLGKGWSLSGIDSIRRDVSYGIHYTSNDHYVSSSYGNLVGNNSVMHSKEESFTEFFPQGMTGEGPANFIAYDQNGNRYTYGGGSGSLYKGGAVKVWGLTEVRDIHSNIMTIDWVQNNGELYPSQITYANGNRTVRFDYEGRSDALVDYSEKDYRLLNWRLKTINHYSDGSLVHTYSFSYIEENRSKANLLSKVEFKKANLLSLSTHHPLEFVYSPGNVGLSDKVGANIYTQNNAGYASQGTIPDLYAMARELISQISIVYGGSWINQSLASMGRQAAQQSTITQGRATNYKTDLAYVERSPLPNKYREQCQWGTIACVCSAFPQCPPAVRAVCADYTLAGGADACNNGILSTNQMSVPTDVDGDGVSEFTRMLGTTEGNQLYLKTEAYNRALNSNSQTFPIKYNTFSSFADIDGDSKTDFVYESGGVLHVAYGNGNGFDGASAYTNVILEAAQQNYTRYSPRQAKEFFVDFNADGRADFIRVYESYVSIQLSQGRSFGNPIVMHRVIGNRNLVNQSRNVNPFQDSRLYDFSDIDGDRIPELVQIFNVSPPPEVSQLNAVLARHQQELVDAENEKQGYKSQVTHVINGGGATQAEKDALATKIHSDERNIYWDLVGRPGEATSGERDILANSIDRQFNEDRLREIYDRQKNELDQELNRIRGVNLSGAQYNLIVTKFDFVNNNLTQSEQILPVVGFMGKNWLRDLNNDGMPELLSLHNENSYANPYDRTTQHPDQLHNTLYTFFNQGGTFNTSPSASTISVRIKPDKFAEQNDPYAGDFSYFDFLDLDNDGKQDFIVKEQGNNGNFFLYYGSGSGTFSDGNRWLFDLGVNVVRDVRFEDRNEDGIPDLFLQYDEEMRTRTYSSTSFQKGGILTSISNGANGGFTDVTYDWKKNIIGAVQKYTGSYNTSLPSLFAEQVVTRISSRVGSGLPISRMDYTYENSRYKPGDLETSLNYGFEKVVERNYIDGTYLGKTETVYQQNANFYGLPLVQEVFNANDVLKQSVTSTYSYYTPHSGTKLRLLNTSNSRSYVNGALKDQKTTTYTYATSFGYAPSVVEENWNGKVTRKEISYIANGSLHLSALPIEEKTFINGNLSAQTKWTYVGGDVASESKLVSSNTFYTNSFSYDARGNVSSTTDSLGRSLSYEYNDLTGSKQTLIRNALGQTSRVQYDPKTDLELFSEDSNGNRVEYEYDSYDRKSATFVNGDKQESYDHSFDGTLFVSTSTTHTAEGDVWNRETTNLLGQSLKSESLVVDGIISTTETRYDALGREIQKSNPYLTGESAVWNVTNYYSATDDTEERAREIVSATGESTNLTYTLRSATIQTTNQSEVIRLETHTSDVWGRQITKVSQGETIRYAYDDSDRLIQINDPGNSVSTITYDIGGRKTRHTDSNSGTTNYTYNVAGDLLTQADARGVTIQNEIDSLGRITKIIPGSDSPILYEYDLSNSVSTTNTVGRLSKVTDGNGITEYAYDRKGNVLTEKKTIDDLQVIFQRTYDAFNRVKTTTYPEGTKIKNHYTNAGQLAFLTMDSHDGNSINHTVVSYEGPKLENSRYYIERKTGNGVLTKIGYDSLRKRPLSYVTYLKDSSVEQSITYAYDKKGNIETITDLMNGSRNQSFEYDHLSRVTKAIGKYGEETYSYHRNGNLLHKGAFTYSYENSNHIHAVTKVNSPNTGILSYGYDTVGNMTTRNGDAYHYNAQGKLKEIVTSGGDRFEYKYDHSGNRIKKSLLNQNTTTYSFGNLYEVYRAPGQPEKHTMYVVGVEGDIVAQYSRSDASLVTSIATNDWLVNPFCSDITVDCGTYWKNRLGFNFISFLADTNVYIDGQLKEGHRAIPWILLIGTLFVIVHVTRKNSESEESNIENYGSEDLFGISLLPNISNYIHKQFPRYATSVILVIFTFTSTAGCFPLLMGAGEGESGTPVWLLGIGGGIPAETPSVSNDTSSGGGGSGSSTSHGHINGMYFYHPDHLGSITMITDGNGNVLAGGERGGKSHITYKPYGEILRTDSYGPDITKFKYTGQEEDKESGLYYYKARYYDSSIGRFISNDGMVFPGKEQGMNRQMYVEGNPVLWRDKTGNYNTQNLLQDYAKYIINSALVNTDDPIMRLLIQTAGNKAMYKMRKNKGSDFQRSEIGKLTNTLSPLNTIGFTWAATNYAAGKILQRDTKLKKVNGGYVVQGGPLMPSGSGDGITLGQFAVTRTDREDSLRHETAHLQQYREWGTMRYLSNLGSSPIRNITGGAELVAENDADHRAGTFSYSASSNRKLLTLYFITRLTGDKSKAILQFAIINYFGYVP